MAKINFGGMMEDVVTREEFPLSKAQQVLKNEMIAVLGYGVQGPGQSLNMRDNGFRVIVGQRGNTSPGTRPLRTAGCREKPCFPWKKRLHAVRSLSTFSPMQGKKLLAEAETPSHRREDPLLLPRLFNHLPKTDRGHSPQIVDVVMVAPKGPVFPCGATSSKEAALTAAMPSSRTTRARPKKRRMALGIAIGSGYLFLTTFENEVYSDLVGERGVLMGAIAGIMEAQYNELRKHGHSPSEAFNETVEEFTQSLIKLAAEKGYGLALCQLQYHGPAGGPGLEGKIPRCRRSSLFRTL